MIEKIQLRKQQMRQLIFCSDSNIKVVLFIRGYDVYKGNQELIWSIIFIIYHYDLFHIVSYMIHNISDLFHMACDIC